jgi:hypothetical protein
MAGQIKPVPSPKPPRRRARAAVTISGAWLCDAVAIEPDMPLFWAWHDHSGPSRVAHGAAYATYVGCWKSTVRVSRGEDVLARLDAVKRRHVRRSAYARVARRSIMSRSSSFRTRRIRARRLVR